MATKFAIRTTMLLALALASCSNGDPQTAADPIGPDASAQTIGTEASDARAADIEMIQVTVGDLTFDARVAGPEDGEPVILLHGFPQTSYEWRHQIQALAGAGYRAFAPDQRGYSPGARPSGVDEYGMALLFGDVLGMADQMGFSRFHLVGHDWGAAVSWVLGALAADRVISLNPVSVPHLDAFSQVRADPNSCQPAASAYFDVFIQPDSEDQFLANDSAGLRSFFTGVAEADIDVYVEALGTKEALGAALNWYRANIPPSSALQDGGATTPPIGPISLPTMYMWSDGDIALCRDGAVLTADFVTGPYRFEVFEGVSHWIPDIVPNELSALLLDHIGAYSAR